MRAVVVAQIVPGTLRTLGISLLTAARKEGMVEKPPNRYRARPASLAAGTSLSRPVLTS